MLLKTKNKLLNNKSVVKQKNKIEKYFYIGFIFLLMSCSQLSGRNLDKKDTSPGRLIQNLYRKRTVNFRNDTVVITPRWFVPDHYRLQYAGNIGFISVGCGYKIGKYYEPTLYYGLLNEAFGDSRTTVHTVSLKNSFNLLSSPIVGHFIPKAGISVNWGKTHNTFKKLPDHYPSNYYFQNKVHLAPFLGGEWQFKVNNRTIKSAGLYFEISTLDAYLLECIRTKYVKINDICNLSIGLSLYIH